MKNTCRMKNSLIHNITHAFVIQIGHRDNYSKFFGSRYRVEFDKQVDKLCLRLHKYGQVVEINQNSWEFFLIIEIITDKDLNSLLKLLEKDLTQCFPQLTNSLEVPTELKSKKLNIIKQEVIDKPIKKKGRPKKII